MEHARKTIVDLEVKLSDLNEEAKKIKNTINCLCEVIGQSVKYTELEDKQNIGGAPRSDEYYGRPLATVVTEFLNKRKAVSLGAANIDEIYKELTTGGYTFTGKNEKIEKRGLAITMSKNRKFHKITSNNTWGLLEWYPGAKEPKNTSNQDKNNNSVNEKEQDMPDDNNDNLKE